MPGHDSSRALSALRLCGSCAAVLTTAAYVRVHAQRRLHACVRVRSTATRSEALSHSRALALAATQFGRHVGAGAVATAHRSRSAVAHRGTLHERREERLSRGETPFAPPIDNRTCDGRGGGVQGP